MPIDSKKPNLCSNGSDCLMAELTGLACPVRRRNTLPSSPGEAGRGRLVQLLSRPHPSPETL
eukprot:scaffold484909_cov11-Prasinocladus_malaysianus.AAC.1